MPHTAIFLMFFAVLIPAGCERNSSEETSANGETSASEDSLAGDAGANAAGDTAGDNDVLDSWVTYQSRNQSWSAKFPSPPVEKSFEQVQDGNLVTITETAASREDGSFFAVRVRRLEDGTGDSVVVPTVENLSAELRLESSTQKETKVGPLPAVDLAGKTASGRVVLARAVATGPSVFVILGSSTDVAEIREFIRNVELTLATTSEVAFEIPDCGGEFRLPGAPQKKPAVSVDVAGTRIVASHFTSNAPDAALAAGLVCTRLTDEIRMSTAPRQLHESFAAAFAKVISASIDEQKHELVDGGARSRLVLKFESNPSAIVHATVVSATEFLRLRYVTSPQPGPQFSVVAENYLSPEAAD